MNAVCTYASVRVESDWFRHVCCSDLGSGRILNRYRWVLEMVMDGDGV